MKLNTSTGIYTTPNIDMTHYFDKIVAHRLRVPLLTPYHLAFGTVEYFDTIIVEAVDHAGNSGFGEATVLTGYTDETIDDSWCLTKQIAKKLVTCNQNSAQREVQQLGAKFPFTATAFGTALELLARSDLLTVSSDTPIPLLGLLQADVEDAMHAEFQRLLDTGYGTIKVKVGFDVETDIRRVRTVQKVVSSKARIRIDANQGYSAAQGIAFVRALDPADIELFEQPCPAGDWESHLAVASESPVPMMLDESIYGIADIEKAATLKAATYIKVKLMKLVTLGALVKAIERIKALGMQPVLGNGVACDPGCWMEACIAARHIGNAGEMNGFLKASVPLLNCGLEVRDGAIVLKREFSPKLDTGNINKYLVDSMLCTPRVIGSTL